jgi:hypothetical protein
MRGTSWSGEPGGGGYRRVLVKRLAVVLALALAAGALAACSSGSGKASPTTATGGVTLPTITIPASTTTIYGGPVVAPVSTCTQNDLDGPTLKMPAGRVVTSTVTFRQYGARLLPADESPRISATSAWFDVTRSGPIRAKSAELLFGTFRATVPGPHGPRKLNVHAWVLRVHELVYAYPPAIVKKSPCIFTDAYYVIDSNDGTTLLIGY